MKKRILLTSVVAFILFSLGAGPVLAVSSPYFTCDGLSVTPANPKLTVDASGTKTPVSITIKVLVHEQPDQSADQYSYRVSVNSGDVDPASDCFGATNKFCLFPLSFTPDPGNPPASGQKATYFVGSVTFKATKDETFPFVVETTGQNSPQVHLVNSSNGSDCQSSFTTGLDTSNATILKGTCASFGLTGDGAHLGCSISSAPNDNTGKVFVGSPSGDGTCSDSQQEEATVNLCSSPPGAVTSGGAYCFTCINSAAVQHAHGEACTDTANSTDCIASEQGVPIRCLAAAAGGSECLHPSGIASKNIACIVGEAECAAQDLDHTPLYCKPSGSGSKTGVCDFTPSCAGSVSSEDAKCVQQLGAGAKCVELGTNTFVCSLTAVTQPTNPGQTQPGTVSNDFGTQNCPYPSTVPSRPGGVSDQVWAQIQASYEKRTPDQIAENNQCVACIKGCRLNSSGAMDCSGTLTPATWTAIGCVSTSVSGVFTTLVRIALGVMGGVVLLRMIYLGYLYQTGDTGKIKEARAGIISTIAGIIVVVFSIVILRVIGVNILNIVPPNFFGTG